MDASARPRDAVAATEPDATAEELVASPTDDPWDPMQSSTKEVGHWTTTNMGEAVPGIITPLGTAQWGLPGDLTARRVGYSVGVMSKAELAQPEPAELIVRFFYGRVTSKLEFTALIGDRMPGITGEEALAGLFGKPPEGMTFDPTRRRYPIVAYKFPRLFLRVPGMLREVVPEVDAWWRRNVELIPSLDLEGSRAVFAEAVSKFQLAMDTQVLAMMGSFRPVFDALTQVVDRAGTGDLSVLSGTGGAEIAVVTDIWKASRGEITLDEVVANHGFHGPGEGEISSRVWREDPSPLERVVEHYRGLPDSEHPENLDRDRKQRWQQMHDEVIAALPRSQRPGARLVMNLARKRVPDRGRAKRSFLQTIDIARMSARRAGEHLAADGVIAERDDVFFFTGDELTGEIPADAMELTRKRKARHREYQRISFKETEWAGMPDAVVTETVEVEGDPDETIIGTAASSGVVEGIVRVVQDPGFSDVEPGEVLVAPTTDPSWSTIMFVSAALVVDLGGTLSHAAVVARELEIPCVVNARDATRRLRTGDRVRVDGKAGTVEILERVE